MDIVKKRTENGQLVEERIVIYFDRGMKTWYADRYINGAREHYGTVSGETKDEVLFNAGAAYGRREHARHIVEEQQRIVGVTK